MQVKSLTCIQAIERFSIETSIPIDGEVSFEEIAKSCDILEADTKRVLRQATLQYTFKETQNGYVTYYYKVIIP